MKQCRKCGLEKPVSEFWRKVASPDGMDTYCIPCGSARNVRNRSNRKESNSNKYDYNSPTWEMAKKTCRTCGKEKFHRQFTKNASENDGLRNECKKCHANRVRELRARSESLGISGRNPIPLMRSNARLRGISFDLNSSQYAELISTGNCTYCGFDLPKIGGLDRKDNSIGYTVDNCVPCCKVCNKARHDFFTYEEMLEIGAVIRQIRLRREEGSSTL